MPGEITELIGTVWGGMSRNGRYWQENISWNEGLMRRSFFQGLLVQSVYRKEHYLWEFGEAVFVNNFFAVAILPPFKRVKKNYLEISI